MYGANACVSASARTNVAWTRRLFDQGVVERLAVIALGRAAGFSLGEIARMFTPDGKPRIDRRLLAAKAERLDEKIRELTAMREGLRHAALCKAPSHMECPTFRRLLSAASKSALTKRRRPTAKAVAGAGRRPGNPSAAGA